MKFLMENSGYIILGICALVVLAGKAAAVAVRPRPSATLRTKHGCTRKRIPTTRINFHSGDAAQLLSGALAALSPASPALCHVRGRVPLSIIR